MKLKIFFIFSIFFFLFSSTVVNAQVYTSFIHIVGVDNRGKGIVGNVTVEIQPGKGRVLVDTQPLQGIDLQHSERVAVKVASDVTGFNFSNYDVIYTIRTPDARIVEGPSAGGALTLATIAAIKGISISPAFSMTGTIQEDGSIGPVGAILAKAKAAADAGITVFLIPKGQAIQNQYVRKVRRPAPGWYIETIEPVPVNVIDYAKEHWGLTVYEVSNIEEAMKYAFGEIPEKVKIPIPSQIPENVTLEPFSSNLQNYQTFLNVAKNEREKAERSLNEIKERLEKLEISDDIKSSLQEILKKAENNLDKAKEFEEKGYAYSSANYAFKSLIDSKTIDTFIDYYSLDFGERYDFMLDLIEDEKSKLNEVKERVLSKTDTFICDPQNFEWAVLARQRVVYAENKLKPITLPEVPIIINGQIITGKDVGSTFFDVNVADEWLDIAESLSRQVSLTSPTSCIGNFEERAKRLLEEAEKEVSLTESMGINVEEANWYLQASKRAFSQGLYLTSIYDSIHAEVIAEVLSKYEGKSFDEIYSAYKTSEFTPNNLISTIFFDHSKSILYEALQRNSTEKAIDALSLLLTAKEINEMYPEIVQNLSRKGLSFQLSLSEKQVIFFLVVIAFASILYALKLKRKLRQLQESIKPRKKLSEIEKELRRSLEKELLKKLKKGEITKREYLRLKKKFSTRRS